MPKHPVPKKKTNKRVSKQRYGSFQTKVLKRLTNDITLATCSNPDCGEKHRAHMVCHKCGQYRGRQVINKQKAIDKITKIKA